jgi:hypothetical protein
MSETPDLESSSAADVTESIAEPEPTPEQPFVSHAKSPEPASGGSGLSKWISFAALGLAVLAIAGAALVYFFPNKSASSTAPTYTDQQVKDAKAHICAAFVTVDKAVVRNTHMKSPPDSGPIGALAVATSARLALYGGGAYLEDRVILEPAAAPDVAKAANAFAATLQDLGMGYLAGAPEFTQDEQRQKLEGEIKAMAGFCK